LYNALNIYCVARIVAEPKIKLFTADLSINKSEVYCERNVEMKTSVEKANYVFGSIAEPHNFYAPLCKSFDAAPAPALTPLYSKAKFVKRAKVETILFI
jgi:hypothetical protein